MGWSKMHWFAPNAPMSITYTIKSSVYREEWKTVTNISKTNLGSVSNAKTNMQFSISKQETVYVCHFSTKTVTNGTQRTQMEISNVPNVKKTISLTTTRQGISQPFALDH
jgi:hypothetical protein